MLDAYQLIAIVWFHSVICSIVLALFAASFGAISALFDVFKPIARQEHTPIRENHEPDPAPFSYRETTATTGLVRT
ncbi:MAG: hypothetical protein KJO60_11700 [Desulfofustis sp.]|nr:hypothetical protein [Desulfofustis sp.]